MEFDAERAGLCSTCRHKKTVPTGKGTVFLMCLKSRTDPAFPRYPPLPVRACRGYAGQGKGAASG